MDGPQDRVSELTDEQQQILTELQKILLTTNQINSNLEAAIKLVRERGPYDAAARDALDKARQAYSLLRQTDDLPK
ncbi:hypothetical protein POJ06DRAFT_28611 [Lipomyces tetrasporus]|uniref:Uncharacterized protein n=1 Tax=Lipomyces tetrasporus TaxID=54092 RepID=A0AAD7VPX5_9ASCO|nr:uncharacterized protein POJ06DRAFT_28611 [Lipomyces tetrasporus]KAJ8097286.1 hypothetical protein POJ06DRAFT_28611 [Lipomyces tetrasporus]